LHVDVVDADPQKSALEWAAPGRLPFRVSEIAIKTGHANDWVKRIQAAPGRVTIIDSPPNEYAMGAAVAVAELVVVPCTPSGLDLAATEHAINAITFARSQRKHKIPILIVPNRVNPRTLEGQQIAEELGKFGEIVTDPIAARLGYVRAFTRGELPEGAAISEEMAKLAARVLAILNR
jgi:chromosome partitioning protein